jgi:para-nitrobenzyl esterase
MRDAVTVELRTMPGSAETLVRTAAGVLRGVVEGGVYAFRGLPYAAPPFGTRRLRPPQPVEPWSGVRDARTWGPSPPQLPYPSPWDVLIPERLSPGEDCLNLNLWTPDPGAARLPVMVYIPGGMFECGSGASYDGSRFARDGVVCVTINYRVGAEGFLFLEDGSPNLGLQDQIAALEWVQRNIAAFGGDPGNVTVFGQSAGAMSVGTLLSMPGTEGLFRRAIAQSGGAHQVMPIEDARLVARDLAERLGVKPTRDGIAAVPSHRVLQAQAALKADLVARPDAGRWGEEVVASVLPWQPVVDGRVLPARPIDRIAAGAGAGVDLMTGATAEEALLFLVPGGVIDQITPDTLAGAMRVYGLPLDAALAAYGRRYPGASPGELLAAVQSDRLFRVPAIRLADAHATRRSATYMYEFAWRSPQFEGRLGACHGLDVGFVFDAPNEAFEPLVGPAPPRKLARLMHTAWIGFAGGGDPGWPRYDLTRRATMLFDTGSEVVDDPRAMERLLWEGVR